MKFSLDEFDFISPENLNIHIQIYGKQLKKYQFLKKIHEGPCLDHIMVLYQKYHLKHEYGADLEYKVEMKENG